MEKGFRQLLKERQEKVNSLLCVGLDPLPEKIPICLKEKKVGQDEKIVEWMTKIVDATVPYAAMFKAQKAHYEALSSGQIILREIISYIKWRYPDIPVFLDCKRGDIDRTQECYRTAHFVWDGANGINFNPYMGKSTMRGLVEVGYFGIRRALVGLCYTSNMDARETQDIKLADGRPYWEFIAETILKWAEEFGVIENAGLVMAAAYENPKGSGNIFSQHLTRCREIVGDKLWFLIPGIGTQGGYIAETVRAAFAGFGSIAINSSSEINFASSGEDFADAAAEKAEQTRDKIRKHNIIK